MMEKYFSFFCFFIFSACSDLRSTHFEVLVKSQNAPVSGAQVTIFSVSQQQLKKQIAQGLTRENGTLKLKLRLFRVSQFKIVVSHQSLERLYLPQSRMMKAPAWWQEKNLFATFDLSQLSFEKATTPSFLKKQKILSQQEDHNVFETSPVPPKKISPLFHLEQSLGEEKGEKNSPMMKQEDRSFFPKIVSEQFENKIEKKTSLLDENLFIEVFFQNKPQENVHLFLGKNSSQSLSYLGRTNSKGVLKTPVSKRSRSQIVIAKKEHFLTLAVPVTTRSHQKNQQTMRIDLQQGQSVDFVLQHFSYGTGRGLDKTELRSHNLKMDVSGLLGFVTFSQKAIPWEALSLNQKNAVPQKREAKILQKCASTKNSFLPSLFVNAVEPYKPAVGFIEPPLSVHQTNLLWRRFRREFFSRFMNEGFFKGIIFDEVSKMAEAQGLSPQEMAKSGWDKFSFAHDLDLIMELHFFPENKENSHLIAQGRVYDKKGRLIVEKRLPFQKENAEHVAAQLYFHLQEGLPLEGSVLEINEKRLTLNLGKNFKIQQGQSFLVFTQSHPCRPPEKTWGVARVHDVQDKTSVADLLMVKNQSFVGNILKVVRYPDKLIDADVKIMSAFGK
jgi:hypothetical protein